MGTPYTLQQRKNPQKRDEPAKWYAVPKSGTPVSEKVMTKLATEDTTVADFELGASSQLLSKWIYNQLIQGKRAKIPGVGTFRLTFGSEGVDSIEEFHTGLIRNVKIMFIPDRDLRESLVNNVSFENAGVIDGDVYYGSLDNYKKVKGLTGEGTGDTGGGSGTTPGGGEGQGGGEGTLG